MQKLDLNALTMISGGGGARSGGGASASSGGVAINGDGNTVNYGNTSTQSSASGSSQKS